MKLSVALLAMAFLCGCADTSYKVAPSTTKVETKLATAQRSVKHAQARTSELETATKAATVTATSTAGHIDDAMAAILTRNYDQALKELIEAKTSNTKLLMMQEQFLRDIQSLKNSLGEAQSDASEAINEVGKVNAEMAKVVLQGAKDRVIVEQGEWAWGAGYFIVGIKRILSHAFWGSLILLGVVAILVGVAFFVGGPLLKGVMWVGGSIFSWWKNKNKP